MATKSQITTDADYQKAIARIDKLMNAEAGTPEADELSSLVAQVVRYEERHHAVEDAMERAGEGCPLPPTPPQTSL